MITTLLIDIDNTLLDFGKCSRNAIVKGFQDNGLIFREEYIDIFHSVNNILWAQIEDGSLTREKLHKIRWGLVFEKLGISADGEKFEKNFVNAIHESHEPVDGAMEFLSYLCEKYTLCAASNGPYEQQCHRLECAGMKKFFTHIFVSDDMGCAKPKIEFFEECQRRLKNIPKNEIMLIGDSLTADIAGGKNFGIATCWFNYGKTDEKSGADYNIKSLLEIKNIL